MNRKTGAETTEKRVCLRLAQHVLDDPLSALRVIARGAAPLPASIFSLADVPFPVCSSFWHKISLLCQRTMVTRPSTPLTQTPQRSFQGAAADTHTPSQPLTAHTAAHRAKQGRFERGWYHYHQTVLCGSETLRGRVSERQTLPFLGLGRVYSQRTQRACGTAMRLCASLFRGVAAPLGCATLPLLLRFALREALQAVAETAENTYPPRTVRI